MDNPRSKDESGNACAYVTCESLKRGITFLGPACAGARCENASRTKQALATRRNRPHVGSVADLMLQKASSPTPKTQGPRPASLFGGRGCYQVLADAALHMVGSGSVIRVGS